MRYILILSVLFVFNACSKSKTGIVLSPSLDGGLYDLMDIESHQGKLWVSGGEHYDSGVLFFSEDEGKTWSEPITIGNKRLNTLCVIEDRFFAGDHDGKIYRSIDAGLNWDTYQTSLWRSIQDIQFLNGDTGYAVASLGYNKGVIYRTVNGGEQWNIVKNTLEPCLNFLFIDESQNIYAGGYGIVLKSNDYGLHWDTLYLTGENFQGALAVDDEIVFYGSGGALINLSNKVLYRKSHLVHPSISWSSHAKFKNNILIAGRSNKLLVSVDNGTHWTSLKSKSDVSWQGLYFINEVSGIMVGKEGQCMQFLLTP